MGFLGDVSLNPEESLPVVRSTQGDQSVTHGGHNYSLKKSSESILPRVDPNNILISPPNHEDEKLSGQLHPKEKLSTTIKTSEVVRRSDTFERKNAPQNDLKDLYEAFIHNPDSIEVYYLNDKGEIVMQHPAPNENPVNLFSGPKTFAVVQNDGAPKFIRNGNFIGDEEKALISMVKCLDNKHDSEIKEGIKTKTLSWENFGNIKLGGLMGFIAKGVSLNSEVMDSPEKYELPKEIKSMSPEIRGLILNKIHELKQLGASGGPATFKLESGPILKDYEIKGFKTSPFQLGLCRFSISIGGATVYLDAEIPTNFHPGEVRNFTNRSIVDDQQLRRLKEDLTLAKSRGDREGIKKAREAMKERIKDVKDCSPKILDSSSFVKIVAKLALKDASIVMDDVQEIDGKPIGEWLRAAHVRLNLSGGKIESFSKSRKITIGAKFSYIDDIKDIFEEASLSKKLSARSLKNRSLGRQIRDTIVSNMPGEPYRDPLDSWIAEQILALEVLMMRKECESHNSKDLKEIRKEMKAILQIMETLQLGKREEGKITQKVWAKVISKVGDFRESLPKQVPLLSKEKYEAPLFSRSQAKVLVEARSVVRELGKKRTEKEE